MNKYLFMVPLIILSPIFTGSDHSYFDMAFDKENRVIIFKDFVNNDRRQIIRGPSEYINCDPKIKRRIRGVLKFRDNEIAKNFPIFDQTSFKVWRTNSRGQFEMELPGGCNASIGTFNKKMPGTSFMFIKETQNEIEQDIVLPLTAYVMSIAESVPDAFIREKLLAGYTTGEKWPRPQIPMACINGYLPEKILDFHSFAINLTTKEYFSGYDYNDRFEVEFSQTTNFAFVAYANKPRGKVSVFIIDPSPLKSKFEDRHPNKCTQVQLRTYKDLTYDELSQFDILKVK